MRGHFVIVGVSVGVLGLGACNSARERLSGAGGSMQVDTPDGSAGAGGAGGPAGIGGADGIGGGAGVGAAGMSGSGGMVVLTPAQLMLDPLSKDLSSIVIGHFAEATFQISNSGQAATSVPTVVLSGSDATQYSMTSNGCTAAIDGGKSCLVTVRFTPTTLGLKMAQLNVSASMGGAVTAMLQGTGVAQGALTINPPNQSLGSILKGQTGSPATFTVTNTGGSATGPLSTTISDSTEIAIATDGCNGMALAPSGKCTITVTLTPMTAGQKGATLTVTASPGGTTSASLTGVGLAPASLAVTPATFAFPDTVVGDISAQTFTIANGGGVAAGTTTALAAVLAVTTGTDAAEIGIASNSCAPTLAAGASCLVGVAFKPTTAAMNKGATLTASASPGGMGSASMTGNGLAAAALSLSPATGASTDFGTIVTNNSSSQTFVVRNGGQQGTSAVTIATTGTDFTIATPGTGDCSGTSPLAPGTSCTIHVKFAPTTTGSKSSTLSASATTGGTKMLSLTGIAVAPGALMIAPATRDFGSVPQMMAGTPIAFTVSNTGGAPTSALTTAVSGSTEFAITTDGCKGMTLAAPGSCSISVTFSPTSGGGKSGTLTVSATTGGTASSSLSGTGLTPAALTISPAIFTFPMGTVAGGPPSAAQSFTVSNTGGVASGTVSAAIAGTDATEFSVASSNCTTLAAGGTCTIGVTFKPTTAGMKSGTVTVTASGASPASATLGGTALAPAQLTIAPAAGSSNNFGSILINNTMLETFVVSNSGEQVTSAPLTITVGGTDFSLATPAATGDCASTTTLAKSTSCVVRVQFKPTSAVVRTGAVSVSAGTGGTATLNPAPTGTGVNPSAVSIMPLTLSFGAVQQSMPSGAHTFTVTNGGGAMTGALTTSITPTDFAITSDGCKGKILAINGTCSITVVMTPQSTLTINGTLTVTDPVSGSTSSAALSGSGLAAALLVISPSPFTFPAGTASNSTSTAQTFTITNKGGVTSGTITASIGGTDSTQFGISSNNCTSLGQGLSCSIGVVFKPTSVGMKAGTLSLAASPGGPATATIGGTAASPAVLTITSTAQTFGSVAQGSSTAQVFTITNTGGATSGALSDSISGTTEFAIPSATDNCKGKTLIGNATCTLTVVLTPVAPTGAKSATLTVTANPGTSPMFALSGTSFTMAALALSPTTGNFGNVPFGTTTNHDLLFMLTNNGSQTAAGITRTVAGTGFSLPSPTATECGSTLAGITSCSIRVRFTPPGLVGSVTGTLSVSATTGSAPTPVSLSANGYGIVAPPFAAGLQKATLGGMDSAGTAIVGSFQNGNAFGYYWPIGAATVTTIPPLPGETSSSDARAISGNASVVTGFSAESNKVWTWTPGATSAHDIGFNPGSPQFQSGFPEAIDNTGSVIVGETFNFNAILHQGFVWRSATGTFQFLGDLSTQDIILTGVSNTGRIVGTQFVSTTGISAGMTWTSSGNVTVPGVALGGDTPSSRRDQWRRQRHRWWGHQQQRPQVGVALHRGAAGAPGSERRDLRDRQRCQPERQRHCRGRCRELRRLATGRVDLSRNDGRDGCALRRPQPRFVPVEFCEVGVERRKDCGR